MFTNFRDPSNGAGQSSIGDDGEVEVGCEIISMEFFESSSSKRGNQDGNRSLMLAVGTSVGVCVANVRTREVSTSELCCIVIAVQR